MNVHLIQSPPVFPRRLPSFSNPTFFQRTFLGSNPGTSPSNTTFQISTFQLYFLQNVVFPIRMYAAWDKGHCITSTQYNVWHKVISKCLMTIIPVLSPIFSFSLSLDTFLAAHSSILKFKKTSLDFIISVSYNLFSLFSQILWKGFLHLPPFLFPLFTSYFSTT